MTVKDSYLSYQTGAVKRTARNRKRWKDKVKVKSGETLGTYIDTQNLIFGRFQDTVDYLSSWNEARRLEKANHLKGMEKYTSRFDYGSPFYSRTVSTWPAPKLSVIRTTASGIADSWNGYVFPHPDARNLCILADNAFPVGKGDTGVLDNLDLFRLGSKGIAETLPSVPSVSIAQSLGELREGLPHVVGTSVLHGGAGQIGDEYLNWMFAIRPTIRDIQSYAKHDTYSDYVWWWNRNAGKLIRRTASLGKTIDESVTKFTDGTPTPTLGGSRHWFAGSRELREFTENETWFSASYRITAPKLDRDRWSQLKDFTEAYGLVPNAVTLWNLTPWSWLLDWVVNFDDFLTNVSYMGKKGVGLHYAYIMNTTTVTSRYSYSGVYRPRYDTRLAGGGPTSPLNLMWQAVTVTKQRQKASPFGFGADLSGLSPTQVAILTALGFSRAS